MQDGDRAGRGQSLHFAQAFGERGGENGAGAVQDVDLISTVRFSSKGDMIATGDKGGRVVLLKVVDENHELSQVEFKFWTQFQSHEPEFDYLKSMEIEEKINRICWLNQECGSRRLLSTNDKTIKLFRIDEREVARVETMRHGSNRNGIVNEPESVTPPKKLTLPKIKGKETVINSVCSKDYANAHAYHINSLSLSSDDETFLSADDLRVNLWHLERGNTGFNVLDIKPENMEDLNEVITCAEFHPENCNLFAISTSRASVKLMDLRTAALCDEAVREFDVPEDMVAKQSFFSEIVASIAGLKFSSNGRYFLTRDYETIRLWDLRRENEPLRVMPVFEQLNSRLVDLYENDCIFDRFQASFSHGGGSVVTGSYNGLFCLFSSSTGELQSAVEAAVDFVSGASGKRMYSLDELINEGIASSSAAELVEPTRRIMHVDASPTEDVFAVAAGPALYIFHSAN
mmetsp:Transcript_11987/g.36520  ORF Transcript_11987/g.36520 Transcript_11987/m.36520 type:complete len:459 (+) Transcript_11987:185-1561(+)